MRSLLLVPGDDGRMQEQALTVGADVLILDLEHAVAGPSKTEARATTRAFLERHAGRSSRPRLFVRVNALASGMIGDDLATVMAARPDAIVLPKAAGRADVQHLSSLLAVSEAKAGLREAATGIVAMAAATAASIFRMGTFGDSSTRLVGLAWAAEELAAAVGAERTRGPAGHQVAEPIELARSLTLFAARAAGIAAIDTAVSGLCDEALLARECEQARRDGFGGKLALHPQHVAIINETFASFHDGRLA